MKLKRNYFDNDDLNATVKVYLFYSERNRFINLSDSEIEGKFRKLFNFNDFLPRKDEIVIGKDDKEYRIVEIKTYYSYETEKRFYLKEIDINGDNLVIKK